ncbi:MAG: hypothetical protein JW891_07295 [Candidatus Lokiarchaeota archaeon]|nr:hypothetical protein [Candidatus Lokiarchaeota archaeon]
MARIGILSKRTTTFAGRMKDYFETKGHEVKIYTLNDLCINKDLLHEQDCFVLKSKKIIYLNAGFFIKANKIPIFPDPELTFKHKNRIQAHYLLKQAGLTSPDFFVGSKNALKNHISTMDLPLVSKSFMDSGSLDATFIKEGKDLNLLGEYVVYFERKIVGKHYIIYFIEDEISVSEKSPLSTEHAKMKEVIPTESMIKTVEKWRSTHDVPFGHLDVIEEDSTGNIVVVDPGNFPEFANWKKNNDPCPKVCDIILNRFGLI